MIEAGSSLIKRQTVLQTTRTHYLGVGKILPTIVQFMGMRDFKTEEGKTIQMPILREVSLPMKWTLGGGGIPRAMRGIGPDEIAHAPRSCSALRHLRHRFRRMHARQGDGFRSDRRNRYRAR